jgi:hypothetical protein
MNTEMTKYLLRRGGFKRKEWLAILENRRAALNPKLDKMTLPKFGDLACMDEKGNRYHNIADDAPAAAGDFTIEDHGVSYFADDGQRLYGGEIMATRHIYGYGLSKTGMWVVIDVEVALVRELNCDREYARCVTITESTLPNMLERSGVQPIHVWLLLLETARGWERKRRILHEDSVKFVREFEILDELMKSIALQPKNS